MDTTPSWKTAFVRTEPLRGRRTQYDVYERHMKTTQTSGD